MPAMGCGSTWGPKGDRFQGAWQRSAALNLDPSLDSRPTHHVDDDPGSHMRLTCSGRLLAQSHRASLHGAIDQRGSPVRVVRDVPRNMGVAPQPPALLEGGLLPDDFFIRLTLPISVLILENHPAFAPSTSIVTKATRGRRAKGDTHARTDGMASRQPKAVHCSLRVGGKPYPVNPDCP